MEQRFKLCVNENNAPVFTEEGQYVAWDSAENILVHLEDTPQVRAQFGLSDTISNEPEVYHDTSTSSVQDTNLEWQASTESCSSVEPSTSSLVSSDTPLSSTSVSCDQSSTRQQTTPLISKSGPLQASWRNDNAVKALIIEWKNHELHFKSTSIRNKKVWELIAKKLLEENPLWNYTAQQCEDKFKDVRKNYTKTKDHNEQSGADLRTCKFYEELEIVLGDKPAIKPVALASSLKRRANLCQPATPENKCASSQSDVDSDNDCHTSASKRKKSSLERNIEKATILKMKESERKELAKLVRHNERMERQDRAIETYKDMMERLLEKL